LIDNNPWWRPINLCVEEILKAAITAAGGRFIALIETPITMPDEIVRRSEPGAYHSTGRGKVVDNLRVGVY
jgi:hypothetical protein